MSATTCDKKCCYYCAESRDWFDRWGEQENQFCPVTGERLNADGTVTPGVWGEVIEEHWLVDGPGTTPFKIPITELKDENCIPGFSVRRVLLVAQEEVQDD